MWRKDVMQLRSRATLWFGGCCAARQLEPRAAWLGGRADGNEPGLFQNPHRGGVCPLCLSYDPDHPLLGERPVDERLHHFRCVPLPLELGEHGVADLGYSIAWRTKEPASADQNRQSCLIVRSQGIPAEPADAIGDRLKLAQEQRQCVGGSFRGPVVGDRRPQQPG